MSKLVGDFQKPIRFVPLYKDYVWGGRAFENVFGRKIPKGVVAESWEIVDRDEAQSIVAEGKYKGLTIRELFQKHGKEILSENWKPEQKFPLLVKWLDANARLSLQVHPPEKVAKELGGEPKTECWYVKDAKSNAGVYAGLKKDVTRQQFEAALEINQSKMNQPDDLEALAHRISTQKDDFISIPSGRLHAIDAGNLILEIQQNSNTTYRVYDWGRPRELHVKESLKSIDFNDLEPQISPRTQEKEALLVKNSVFTVRRYFLGAGEAFAIFPSKTAQILSIVDGNLNDYKTGENLLIPRGQSASITAKSSATILVTSDFL